MANEYVEHIHFISEWYQTNLLKLSLTWDPASIECSQALPLGKNACFLLSASVTATICFPGVLWLGGRLVLFLHAASSKSNSVYAFVFFSWVENTQIINTSFHFPRPCFTGEVHLSTLFRPSTFYWHFMYEIGCKLLWDGSGLLWVSSESHAQFT